MTSQEWYSIGRVEYMKQYCIKLLLGSYIPVQNITTPFFPFLQRVNTKPFPFLYLQLPSIECNENPVVTYDILCERAYRPIYAQSGPNRNRA
jgi:hypothetical protein